MSKTAGIIATGQRDSKEFCFVIKPAPGSRKNNVVSSQRIPDIEEMVFISNYQVLVKFKYGKCVVFYADGSANVYANQGLRDILDSTDWKTFAGQSLLVDDTKYIAINVDEIFLVVKFYDGGKVKFVSTIENLEKDVKSVIHAERKRELQLLME